MIKNLCRIICAICLLSVTMQAIAAEKNSFEGYDRAQVANTNYEKMHGKTPMAEEADDPELAATMKKYIYGDLSQQIKLTDTERQLITLVVLTTNQNHKFLKRATEGALALKVTPLQIREALYHVAPYIGFPKVFEALEVTNGVFKEQGISLPLENQGTTTDADRYQKGLEFRVNAYGDRITRTIEISTKNHHF